MRTYSIHFRWLPELLVALGLLIAMPFSIAQTHQMEAGFPDTVNFHQLELRQEVSWTKKLPAGFDVGLEEELREVIYSPNDDPAAYFSKCYTTLNVGYKMLALQSINTGYKYGLKLDLGYTLKFNAYSLQKALDKDYSGALAANECLQHRPYVSLSGSMNFGQWKLSLKETYRVNFRLDSVMVADKWNPAIRVAEKNPNLMEMKSRLRVDYSLLGKPIKFFCYGEATATLNEPDCPWINSEGKPLYGGQYLRSAKASVGVRWRIDQISTLSFSYVYYFKQDRDININGKNSSSKQNVELTMERVHTHAIVIAYEINQ